MSRITLDVLREKMKRGDRIAVLTAYDASFASLLDSCGIDVLLVGDSLGMVIQGHDTTLPVSMDDMIYHSANVTRANRNAYVVVDMPYRSYDTAEQAVSNASRLVDNGGADMVKLEGGSECLDAIRAIHAAGIPICGHLGLQPQSVEKYGGYKVQGRDTESAAHILGDALLLNDEGVGLLVLECIPRKLAREINSIVTMPVIGIGAGPDCNGQVLVTYDMLGLTQGRQPRFIKNFMVGQDSIEDAVHAYITAVREGRFPTAEHCYD